MNLHRKHNFRLILIIIAIIFYFLANIQRAGIPGAIFNLLQNDFAICASKVTLLGAIFCYVYAFAQLIVGLLVDKFGGFRVIALGAITFGIGSIIFPCSQSLIGLYISRALLGFGAATFHLSTVREVKKYTKDKNFSLAISYILFFGYTGGFVANAPLVASVDIIGWRSSFGLIALFTLLLTILFLILLYIFKPIHIEKETKFSFSPIKEVVQNQKNINLYIFGAINYGVYYVLQSVLGKKFLEDFCHFEINQSALVLSCMAIISACAGTVVALISKSINNRRAIIFKTVSIIAMLIALIVSILLFFNIQTKLIAILFLISSFIGSLSPILILTLHLQNRYEITSSAISIQNFSFFMTVGILGTIAGLLMNIYKPTLVNGDLIYSNQSYLLVFGLFFILSLIEVFFAFKLKDKY